MYQKPEYGLEPLSVFVDRFLALSFNNDRANYKNWLILAEEVFNDIHRQVIRAPKRKRVRVDKTTMTAQIPPDCAQLVEISILDCKANMRPMDENHNKYVQPLEEKGCGCTKCSCKSPVCSNVKGDLQYVSEDIFIGNVKYQKVITTQVQENGDMIQETLEPYVVKDDEGENIVEFRTKKQYLASLDVKPCGCIEATPKNVKAVSDCCGYPVTCCVTDDYPMNISANGQYKVEDKTVFLFDSYADYVIVSYFTNGSECNTEILIPADTSLALYDGMFYYSMRWRKGQGYYEKRQAEQTYEGSKTEIMMYRNPIMEELFFQAKNIFPKW